MNNLISILYLVILLPIFLISIFIPYWTKTSESFGVTIPDEIYASKEIKGMRKSYAFIMAIISLLSSLCFIIIGLIFKENEEYLSIYFSMIVGAYLFISFLFYLKYHMKMKTLKMKENWAKDMKQQMFISTDFRQHRLIHSHFFFLLPILVVIGLIIFTFNHYHQLPEQLPMQYNFDGEVTRWVSKSYMTVLLHPIMITYLTLLFLFVNVSINKAKQQLNPKHPEASIKRAIIFRRAWSFYTIMASYLMTLLFLINQLSLVYSISNDILFILTMVITGIIILGALCLSLMIGQGGSRIRLTEVKKADVMERDDDKHWKLGIFYFNPNDPAIFLEKRFGIGWTMNFARPLAWIILVGILVSAFLIPLLFN